MTTATKTLDYNELLSTLMGEWQPRDTAERQMVVDIAEARWGMWRMTALEVRLWNREMSRRESSEAESMAFAKELQAVTRAGVLYSRRYNAALSRLLRMRREVATEPEGPGPKSAAGRKNRGLRLVGNERLAA